MKRFFITALILLITTEAMGQLIGGKKDQGPQTRSLQGMVSNKSDSPLKDAVVYLKNTKTTLVKTYITSQDGTYRFNALSANVDYEIYAEYQGAKSDGKTLSSFDSRKEAHINLKVDEARK